LAVDHLKQASFAFFHMRSHICILTFIARTEQVAVHTRDKAGVSVPAVSAQRAAQRSHAVIFSGMLFRAVIRIFPCRLLALPRFTLVCRPLGVHALGIQGHSAQCPFIPVQLGDFNHVTLQLRYGDIEKGPRDSVTIQVRSVSPAVAQLPLFAFFKKSASSTTALYSKDASSSVIPRDRRGIGGVRCAALR
jgi:hypothetical protein